MKNNQTKSKMPLFGLLAVLIVGIIATTAFAHSGFGKGGFGPSEDVQEAMENGDYDAWRNAMDERFSEDHFNEMRGMHQERYEHHEVVEAALESGDFEAWQEARGDRGNAGILTEEGFAIMGQVHEAMEDGDIELAQQLREQLHEELGVEGCPGMGGKGKMGGMHGGSGMRGNH